MFDFLRPIQDPTLRIMIPEEIIDRRYHHHHHHGSTNNSRNGTSGQCSSCYDESEDDDGCGNNVALSSPQNRRKFKAYTVMQRSGFQHTEYVQILTHLCKAEIFISAIYGIHGLYCPGFQQESSYQGTCHINVLSSLVGLFTGGMGIGAVHRFRWRTMLVCWLIMCIISSVANLLSVITTGVWLDHLSKLKSRTGIANGLSGLMLLGNVLVGVCFILTSVIICHYWASNSTRYQPVGRVAKRTVPRTHQNKRRSTRIVTSIGNKNYSSTAHSAEGFYQNTNFNNKNFNLPTTENEFKHNEEELTNNTQIGNNNDFNKFSGENIV